MSIHYSDEKLCSMIKNPKEKELAFKIILDSYKYRLYSFVRRMVKSHEDTDDILQNTFLKVYKYIHTFENKSSLYTWIYRIATNETLGFLEKEKNQKQLKDSVYVVSKETQNYEIQSNSEEEIWQYLNEAIDTLPPRQQLVFKMRYFEKITYSEMAKILSVTEGSLKSSFHHALNKISTYIKHKIK